MITHITVEDAAKLISRLTNANEMQALTYIREAADRGEIQAADALEELRAELEQAKAERDAAIEDIDSILAKAELIRRKIGYCLDYDSDDELASLCGDYCKNNGCKMCYEEREDGGCGNFLWRSQKED